MCGIAGFVGAGSRVDIERMTARLAHRGPDGQGFHSEPEMSLYLGHRRLAIIDIAGGTQPMVSRDGTLAVIYNGEIYNAPELRKQLERQGCVFTTDHSDTEVLLHGYRAWGEQLTSKLNGMWAFALLDKVKRKLILSRDRFGQKPLFFAKRADLFVFASELTAIAAHSSMKLSGSPLALQKYRVHGYFPGAHTPYQGVEKVPAGSILVLELPALRYRIANYWSFIIEPDERGGRHAIRASADTVRELLERSVQEQLVSDVPLGILLSGGLDSAAIACLANRHAGRQLRTFSIGFDDPTFDETACAQRVAGELGALHEHVVFTPALLPDAVAQVFRLLDAPLSDSSMLSCFLLCQLARKQVKVVLGGDGSDELFAGYETFRALGIAAHLEALLPRPLHRGLLHALSWTPRSHGYMSLRFKIERLLMCLGHPPSLWNPLWLSPFSRDDMRAICEEPAALEELFSEAIELWDRYPGLSPLDRSLQFYANMFLQDQVLVKIDRMSMMHGLEVRSPFLDNHLVDYVRTLPAHYKLRHGQGKYVLKKAMEPLLRQSVIWRKKIGFSAPLGKWLADGSLVVDAWPGGEGARRYLRGKAEQHRKRRHDHRLLLWNSFVFMKFAENHPEIWKTG